LRQMCPKSYEVELTVADEHRHAGPSVSAGDRDTVNVRVCDAWKRTDRLRHFRGCDIFTFPAEGVSDTIDEIDIALLVSPHKIAGTKPGVPRTEHASEYLLF